MTTKPKADDHIVPPFLNDANARPGPRPGAFLVEVTERELEALYGATVEVDDQLRTVQRVAEFMEGAITDGFADETEARNMFRLIALALDPNPSLAAEKAARFSDRLLHLTRHKPEGKP